MKNLPSHNPVTHLIRSAIVFLGLTALSMGFAQTFTSLGRPPGFYQSKGYAVSGDGQVVLLIEDYPDQGLWTSASGFQALPSSSTSGLSFLDINSNGSVLLAQSGYQAALYTVANGQSLISPVNFRAVAMNDAGTFVAGTAAGGSIGIPAIWNTVTNKVQTLLYGAYPSVVNLAQDGTTLVGIDGYDGYVWRPNSTNLRLSNTSSIGGVNANGTLVAGATSGIAIDESGRNGFFVYDTTTDSAQLIPSLSSGGMPFVLGMTPTGDAFYGLQSGATDVAVYWTQSTGLVNFQSYLASQGLGSALTGWSLTRINDSSADGRTFVGEGLYNGVATGWTAQLAPIPEPSTYALAMAAVGLVAVFSRRLRRQP